MEPEGMTERQILAHCRKIKRQIAQETASMTWEEKKKRAEALRKKIKEEYGLNLIYEKSRGINL
jgi:hypothetical protein